MERAGKHVSFGSLIEAFHKFCAGLNESRQNGKVRYSIADAILSGFACMFFQDRSLLQFQRRMEDKEQLSNLQTLFKVNKIPEDTQLRDILDSIPSESFRPLFKEYFSRLQRGKHLERFRIFDNKYLLSIDGTQYFTSKQVSCPHCLSKEHKNGESTFHHQALQGAIVHPDCRQVIPLIAEDIRNEDGSKNKIVKLTLPNVLFQPCVKTIPNLI